MRNETSRQTAERAQTRGRSSADVAVEVPVGGWNTRDSQDNIPQTDAIIMDNWIPGLGAVETRKGKRPHAWTGSGDHSPGTVETLCVYNSGAANILLACEGDKIFDVSSFGAAETPLTNNGAPILDDVFDFTNFRGSGDWARIIMCNGANNPIVFPASDGEPTPGADLTAFEEITPPLSGTSWSGVPAGCHSFKNRMYYWKGQDQSVYYTSLYAPGGELQEFPLGAVGQFGGYIVGMYTWTHDGGSGPDDYAVFVMSSGETLVYQGEYPGSLSNWSIVGIYNIGTPLHSRGVVKFGGDLIIMTDLDFVFLSNAILGVEANQNLTKISGAIQDAAGNAGQFGWDAILYPLRKYLIFNVPTSSGYVQFVMNTITGSWCRLLDLNAQCWVLYDGEIYFGSDDGVVYKAFVGDRDEVKQFIYEYPEYEQMFTRSSGTEPTLGRFLDTVVVDGLIQVSLHEKSGDSATGLESISQDDIIRVELDASNWIEYTVTNNPLYSLEGTHFTALATISDFAGSIIGDSVPVTVLTTNIINVYEDLSLPINSEIQTAWLNFGSTDNKMFSALKLFFRAATKVIYSSSYAVDFSGFKRTVFDPSDETAQTPWGSPWGSPWSSAGTVSERWEMITGYGRVVSMRMKVSMKSSLSWELSIWHIEAGDSM